MKFLKLFKLLTLSMGFFLVGCGTTQMEQTPNNAQQSAKIHVYRPSAFFGSGLRAPVYVNGTNVGKLGSGGSIIWFVQPGRVTVSTSQGVGMIALQKNTQHAVTFNTQKGKTYNVELTIPYQVNFTTPLANADYEVKLVNSSN